jgi:hypothetical protein
VLGFLIFEKVKGINDFVTCHGNVLWNEYEPLDNALDQCHSFLQQSKNEFVIISLKIDDYNNFGSQNQQITNSIDQLLSNKFPKMYQYLLPSDRLQYKDAKGKILILSRIEGLNSPNPGGTNWSFQDNTCFSDVNGFYLQDRYHLDWFLFREEREKFRLMKEASQKAQDKTMVLLNFASGYYGPLLGISTLNILNCFGKERVTGRLGWIMCDNVTGKYLIKKKQVSLPFNASIIDFIIDSNQNYKLFDDQFETIHDDLSPLK